LSSTDGGSTNSQGRPARSLGSFIHSSWVGSVSFTRACRCRTTDSMICFTRGSAFGPVRASTTSVELSSLKNGRSRASPSGPPQNEVHRVAELRSCALRRSHGAKSGRCIPIASSEVGAPSA
jgi:hypothetical protein